MNSRVVKRDLVVLVADRNMEFAVLGLLSRTQSLRLSRLAVDVYVHPQRDPGCLRRADAFLQPFRTTHRFALVLFDREGCGKNGLSREEIERELEDRLAASGWNDRAGVIVVDPELESWVWSDSPHVSTILGWNQRAAALAAHLEKKGLKTPGQIKPPRPKEAVEEALRHVRKQRSSALYKQLAESVGLSRCVDPAFKKFRNKLVEWFGSA